MFTRAQLVDSAPHVARRLLGAVLLHDTPWGQVRGRIVETEAYDSTDAASHSYRGITPRTWPMFGPAGHLYVYRSYGIHLCLNITCGPNGFGAAVLVRALEPLTGFAAMAQLRGLTDFDPHTRAHLRKLCCGPGNLAQALGVNLAQSGDDVLRRGAPLRLRAGRPIADDAVCIGPRVGITRAIDRPWRFGVAHSPWLSKKFAAWGGGRGVGRTQA